MVPSLRIFPCDGPGEASFGRSRREKSGGQAFDPCPRLQVRFRHLLGPVEQGAHGFGNAHVQAVADPGVRNQRALPDGQGNDELGRMAVGRDEQVLLREPERLSLIHI